MYGIKGKVLNWIEAFLTGRQQHVVVNGTRSQQAPVLSGVPQGSVLGPVLFTIFVNDMPELAHSMILMFDDDTKIFRRIDTIEDSEKLQNDLDKLMKWSEDWQLRLTTNSHLATML